MKRGIASALIIAVVLIGGASWYRFAGSSTPSAGLVAVDNQALSEERYEELLATFLETDASSADSESLTATDLIGRQMVIDYLSMASEGQVSTTNITNLGEKYAESLTTLAQAPRISFSEIKLAGNTQKEVADYVNALNEIYHKGNLAINTEKLPEDFGGKDSPELMNIIKIYENRALSIKNLATPSFLVEQQLALVNNLLFTAWAFEAIGQINSDPALGVSGLMALNQGLDEDTRILFEMSQLIQKNAL